MAAMNGDDICLLKKVKGRYYNLSLYRLDIQQEFYVGVTIDRVNYKVVVIVCSRGGVDIEETARVSPDIIHKLSLGITDPLYPHEGIALAKKMGVTGGEVRKMGDIIVKLYKVFKEYDAKLVEINPLVRLSDGSYVAADARMSLDDDALFRHPELVEKPQADIAYFYGCADGSFDNHTGEAIISTFQKLGFKIFELRAQTQLLYDCLQFLKDNGGVGAGMSSWGPAIYAFGENLAPLQQKVDDWLDNHGGGESVLTKANNTGMRIVKEDG